MQRLSPEGDQGRVVGRVSYPDVRETLSGRALRATEDEPRFIATARLDEIADRYREETRVRVRSTRNVLILKVLSA